MKENREKPVAVLMSVRPKWVNLMASGEKTLEIRKNYPKQIEAPFKVIVYCTKDDVIPFFVNGKRWNGYVVGEFTCRGYEMFRVPFPGSLETMDADILRRSCAEWTNLHWYAGRRTMFGWDVSDFELYDEPQELEKYGYHTAPFSWNYIH